MNKTKNSSVYVKAARRIHANKDKFSCYAICGVLKEHRNAIFKERQQYEIMFGFTGCETVESLSPEMYSMGYRKRNAQYKEIRVLLLLLAAQIFAE